jgi:hypothetical protein
MLRNPPLETVISIQQCLERFASTRRGDGHVLDYIRVKEMAMIEMLQAKAEAVKAASRAPSPLPERSDHASNVPDLPNAADASATLLDINPDLDQSLQLFLDQFWGSDSVPGLDWPDGAMGGQPGNSVGTGEEVIWGLGSLLPNSTPGGQGETG